MRLERTISTAMPLSSVLTGEFRGRIKLLSRCHRIGVVLSTNRTKWTNSEQNGIIAILGILFPASVAGYFGLPANATYPLFLLNADIVLHLFFAVMSICWAGSLVFMLGSRLPLGKNIQMMCRDFSLILLVVIPLIVCLTIELNGVYLTYPSLAPLITPVFLVGVFGIFLLYMRMVGSKLPGLTRRWVVRHIR